MIQQFIGRKAELEFLEKHHGSGKAEFIVIYGRRRIGKTELLLRFLEGKKSFSFMGRVESEEETFTRINLALSRFFNDFVLVQNPLRKWDLVFDYIFEKARKERLAVVFDEFPFLISRFPEILSALQDKWDRSFRESRIFLILCGSSIGMMEEKVLSYKSPLYGRRTGQWKVTGLRLEELKRFFPKYAAEDVIRVYGAVDTIPGYLVKFDPHLGFMENVKQKMLSKGEFLYEEPEFLLREEFRDASNYTTIINSIGSGSTSFNEIHMKTHLDKSLISKYLHTLEKLGIVNKSFPATAGLKDHLKPTKGLYSLSDKFFSFWLTFVYRNKESLEAGKTEAVLDEIRKTLDHYLGPVFEDACRQLIGNLKLPIRPTKLGRWWYKDKEIDLVCLEENKKEALFVECKWSKLNAKEVKKILERLKGQSPFVEWKRKKEHFAVIGKKILGKENLRREGLLAFDLDDLFKKSTAHSH